MNSYFLPLGNLTLQKKVDSYKKEFAPTGANSFLEELNSIEKGGKKKMAKLLPL